MGQLRVPYEQLIGDTISRQPTLEYTRVQLSLRSPHMELELSGYTINYSYTLGIYSNAEQHPDGNDTASKSCLRKMRPDTAFNFVLPLLLSMAHVGLTISMLYHPLVNVLFPGPNSH